MEGTWKSASKEEVEDVIKRYNQIKEKVQAVVEKHKLKQPTLVAVSKTKPPALIQALYDLGHRDFGENYAQELMEKAQILPKDIRWHFIGHLQSNKAKKLVEAVPSLHTVETVDSLKLSNQLNKAVAELRADRPLHILVQVNTSGEESKSGVSPSEVAELVENIIKQHSSVKFKGLMTIGAPDASPDQPDFKKLLQCKKELVEKLKLDSETFEVSMGMSHDFEEAIAMGSTNVRVGSSIFGPRDYSKQQFS